MENTNQEVVKANAFANGFLFAATAGAILAAGAAIAMNMEKLRDKVRDLERKQGPDDMVEVRESDLDKKNETRRLFARKLRAEQMADKERVAESKISDAVLKATTPDNID